MNHIYKTTNFKRFLAFILSFSQILTSCNTNNSSKKDCPYGAHEKKWNSEKNAWSCPGGNHPREGSKTTRSANQQANIKYAEADFTRYQQRMQHSMEETYYGGDFFERSKEALRRADDIVKARHAEQKSRRKSEFAKLKRIHRVWQEEEKEQDTEEHLYEQQKPAPREAEDIIEEEIRRKRGEDWLREGREKIEREKQEQEREWARREEEARLFIEQSHREAQEAWNNAWQKRDQYYEEQRQLKEKQQQELERLRPFIQQQLEEEKQQKEAERLRIEEKKQAKKARRAAKEKARWKEIKEATRKSQEELHKKHEDILRESEAHVEEVERTCKLLYQEQQAQLKVFQEEVAQKSTLERIKQPESVESTPEGWIEIKRLEQKDVELEQAKSEVEDLICQEFKHAPSERLERLQKFEDSNQISPPISELFRPTDVGSPDLSMYDLELDMNLGLSDDEEDWIKHANKAEQMWEEGMKARLPEHIVPLKISLEQAAKCPISEEEYEELQASKEKWLNFKETYGMLTENDKAELTKVRESAKEKKQESESANSQEGKATKKGGIQQEEAKNIQNPEKGKTDRQNKKQHQAVSKETENLAIGKQEDDNADQEADIDETEEESIASDETDEDVDSDKEEKENIYILGLTLENAVSSVEAYVEAVQTGVLSSEEIKAQGKALLQKIESLKKQEKYSFRIHTRLIDDMDEVPAEMLQAQIETHKTQLKILRSLRDKLQQTCSFTEEELTSCKVRIKKVKEKDIEAYEVDSSDEEDKILGSYSRADLAFQKGVGKGVIKALKEAPQTIKNDLQDLVDTIATQNITTIIKGLLGFIQQVPSLLVSLGEYVESIEGDEAAKGEELGKYIADKIILYTLGRQTKLLADLGKMAKLGKAMEEILKEAYKAEQALKGMKKISKLEKQALKKERQAARLERRIKRKTSKTAKQAHKLPPKEALNKQPKVQKEYNGKDKEWNGKYRKKKIGVSGKEGAKNPPEWAKDYLPIQGESGKEFAKRIMNEKYGPGNYNKGPKTEFNKIKKWADRSFE